MLVNKVTQTGHGKRLGFAEKLAGQTGFGTKVHHDEQVELNGSTDDWTLEHYIHGPDKADAMAAARIWVQKHSNSKHMKRWGQVADATARQMLAEAGA